jgi:hypothetical protein
MPPLPPHRPRRSRSAPRFALGAAAAATALLSAAPSPAAATTIWERGSGQWSVSLYQARGQDAWCSWNSSFPDGRAVAFMIRDRTLVLFVSDTRGAAPLDRLGGETLTLSVAGRTRPVEIDNAVREGGLSLARGVVVGRGENVMPFLRDFALASEARVVFPGGRTWALGLRGTAASIEIMNRCLQEMNQRNAAHLDGGVPGGARASDGAAGGYLRQGGGDYLAPAPAIVAPSGGGDGGRKN